MGSLISYKGLKLPYKIRWWFYGQGFVLFYFNQNTVECNKSRELKVVQVYTCKIMARKMEITSNDGRTWFV